MEHFERFMESWGLLTQDLMRSTGWRRWAGIALGALSVWLMLALMATWAAYNWVKRAAQWAMGDE